MTMTANESGRNRTAWQSEIMRRVRQTEARRQITHNSIRKAGVHLIREARARAGIPALLPEYAKVLLGSALGFWIITWLLSYLFGVKPLYSLMAFGFFYSTQAAYYTYKLSVDPTFKIPRCGCAGTAKDNSEVVLRSSASGTLKVPSAALGAAMYAALAFLLLEGHLLAASFVVMLAVAVSAYLGYVMVVRLSALCSNCINIAAVNLLLLWRLLA